MNTHVCLLVFWVMSLNGQTKVLEKPNLQENVLHRLRQLNLEGSVTIFLISEKGDHLYAKPVFEDGTDRLWEDFHKNKIWIKCSPFWTELFHKRPEGWRSAKNSSLHVIVYYFPDKTRYYEMHLDNWAPKGIKNPVNSVRHIFAEVLWHKVTGKKVNQRRIARGLIKIDENLH